MMLVWVLSALAIAVVLMIGIERLIARLGVKREEPAQDGLGLLAERLERWSSERLRK
jgi:hypothetical protein